MPEKDARRLFRESDELAAKLADEWAGRAKIMPVSDPDSSDLLHLPVYDCATDLFELPCESRRDELATQGLAGLFRSWADEEARHRTGAVIGRRAQAVVDGGDFIDLLYAQTLEPGASISRLVRTAEDGWEVVRWRAGMRPSASGVDPLFLVPEIAAEPGLWLERETEIRARRRTNPDWIRTCRLCPHLSSRRREL